MVAALKGVVAALEGVVAALEGGGQVVDVGGGQAQRLDLGQLPVLGVGRDQVPAINYNHIYI